MPQTRGKGGGKSSASEKKQQASPALAKSPKLSVKRRKVEENGGVATGKKSKQNKLQPKELVYDKNAGNEHQQSLDISENGTTKSKTASAIKETNSQDMGSSTQKKSDKNAKEKLVTPKSGGRRTQLDEELDYDGKNTAQPCDKPLNTPVKDSKTSETAKKGTILNLTPKSKEAVKLLYHKFTHPFVIPDAPTGDEGSDGSEGSEGESSDGELEDSEHVDVVERMDVSYDEDGQTSEDGQEDSDASETGDEDDSGSDGEADLNRRIAISNIGKKQAVGQSSRSENSSAGRKRGDLGVNDPAFADWLNELVNQQIEAREQKKSYEEKRKERRNKAKGKKEKRDREREERRSARKDKKANKKKNRDREKPGILDIPSAPKINKIKSPSTGTIYQPGLVHDPTLTTQVHPVTLPRTPNSVRPNLIDQISDFVEKIRVQSEESSQESPRRKKAQVSKEAALLAAEKEVVNAELFKASVEAPAGKADSPPLRVVPVVKVDPNNCVPDVDFKLSDADGDFFKLVSHVEPALREKIARGEYVELEKLLPKKRIKPTEGEKKLQMVNRDGFSYLIAANSDSDQKIYGYRKWEQAFRVYGQIYSLANPHRAAEIWEYVDTIHSASTSFQWENVVNYDYHFRKVMAQKPARCWGTTNTHLWTYYLRDNLKTNQLELSKNKFRKDKDESSRRDVKYCWKYNRHKCSRSARECRFEHRCSYCDSSNHIYLGCPKRNKNESSDSKENDQKNQNISLIRPHSFCCF